VPSLIVLAFTLKFLATWFIAHRIKALRPVAMAW